MSADESKIYSDYTKYWNEQASKYFLYFETVKFMVIFTLICTVLGVYGAATGRKIRIIMRSFVILLMLFISGIYIGAKNFYSLEQGAYTDIDAMQSLLVSRGLAPPDQARLDQFRDRLRDAPPYRKWWHVRFFDRYYGSWFVKTFFGEGNKP